MKISRVTFSVLVLGAILLFGGVAEAQVGLQYYALTPCRVIDTRIANPQQPSPRNTTAVALPGLLPPPCPNPGCQPEWPTSLTDPENPQNFKVRGVSQSDGTGNCGVPTTATAISANLTIVTPLSNGNVRVWPYGGSMPLVASILVTTADTALSNGVIIPLPAYSASSPDFSARFTVYPKLGGAHFVVDITGYFAP